jgi:hypothetical protein
MVGLSLWGLLQLLISLQDLGYCDPFVTNNVGDRNIFDALDTAESLEIVESNTPRGMRKTPRLY